MFRDVNIKLPYIDQWQDTKNKKWAGRTCAICCLKMILVFKDNKNAGLSIMDLVKEGLDMRGYIKGVGWSHKAIALMAKKHGVRINYKKKFYKIESQKLKGLVFMNKNLKNNKPVIASILNSKRTGGHLVVINGFEYDNRSISDYHILDPDSRGETEYFLSVKEFIEIWRGGLLWLS